MANHLYENNLHNSKRLLNNYDVKEKITIKDIARALNVNAGTISRALTGKPGVSPDLRKKIAQKAVQMNYRPNGHARGLVTQRTETLGLLFRVGTSELLSNAFYAEVLAGIEEESREHNYSMMFASTGGIEIESMSQFPKFIYEHRVDGVLVVGAIEAVEIGLLKKDNYPCVLIDYSLPNENIDCVITNNRRGGKIAAEHLLQLGHRHIAFVGGGPLDEGNFWERLEGYKEALKEAGIPFKKEYVQGGAIETGYESALQILDRAPQVTAIVGCNDANALGAMNAVRSRHMHVPADFSIVGFDDIRAAQTSWPALTTMRVDKRAMGKMAAQRLIRKLTEKEGSAPFQLVFSPELVARGTTAAPRSGP